MRRWGPSPNPSQERNVGRWGDGEMGRWGDGEMGRWGDGDPPLAPPPFRRGILRNIW
ncbi:hypothetical protein [Okeania sp. SIO2B3]|uniref:hypothetical protein n=1 Tax=Okeania sp. SIO2B3 TaxID=2607784 RepID=UPI0025F24436|nr:hypothetical protein [Okeania sp. SIO2B3]